VKCKKEPQALTSLLNQRRNYYYELSNVIMYFARSVRKNLKYFMCFSVVTVNENDVSLSIDLSHNKIRTIDERAFPNLYIDKV